MKLAHYLELQDLERRYPYSWQMDFSKLDPETLAGVQEWKRKLESGEITIHRLEDHPYKPRFGFTIIESLDMLGMFGSDEEDAKQAWLEEGNPRFSETVYQTPFLLSPRLSEAIDALPGEYIYLHTDYDGEECFEGIISLMKINVRCETTSQYGFSDGAKIREFTSSAEVVEFLEEKYPALKTYHHCGSAKEILAAGSFTVDYLRTQMLKEKLTSLKVRLGESGEEIELPVTTVRAENDCDCYRVYIGGALVGEWLNRLQLQGEPMVCEIIGIQNILVSNARY
jgi:hypothetical protein